LGCYERAVGIRRELARAQPGNRQFALDLAEGLVSLGQIQRHDGRGDAALASFRDARGVVQNWLNKAQDDAELEVRLAAVLDLEANTLAEKGDPGQAKPLLETALAHVQSGADRPAPAGTDVKRRELRTEVLWDLARVLRALELPDDARTADDQREAMWQDRPPGELMNLVLQELKRATLIGYGKSALSPGAKSVQELDLKQAAANLRLAVARGLKDLSSLRSHPDAAILLSRDDLRSLSASAPSPK
jgi:hypothetical protein